MKIRQGSLLEYDLLNHYHGSLAICLRVNDTIDDDGRPYIDVHIFSDSENQRIAPSRFYNNERSVCYKVLVY